MNALEYLSQTRLAYDAGKFGNALATIAEAEAEGKACPELLILKGACIQLASETDFPVDHALNVYDQLLANQPRNARALLERAFFLLNVSDDPKRAKEDFCSSANLFGELLQAALSGAGKCALEGGAERQQALAEAERFVERVLEGVRASLQPS